MAANPALRRYANGTLATTWTALVGPVPTARALVVAKLVVTGTGSATTFSFAVTTVAPPSAPNYYEYLAYQISLAASGQVYTETNFIVPAGAYLSIWNSVAGAAFTAYGEEVDN